MPSVMIISFDYLSRAYAVHCTTTGAINLAPVFYREKRDLNYPRSLFISGILDRRSVNTVFLLYFPYSMSSMSYRSYANLV
jgi:hypothetical protein